MKGIKTAGNILRSLVLVAVPFFSCNDECYTHNQRTIPLNQDTDGEVSSLTGLEWPDHRILNRESVDFINETHALGTESLPQDIKLTPVSNSCFKSNPNTLESFFTPRHLGYAVLEGDGRGIYTRDHLRFDDLGTVNHEIGHFQQGGATNEVIAQLNRSEQGVLGLGALLHHTEGELVRYWLEYAQRDNLEFDIGNYIINLLDGHNSPDWVVEAIQNNKMVATDIFLFQRLQKVEGNLALLRDEVRDLVENEGLESAIMEETQAFVQKHYSEESLAQSQSQYARIADTTIAVRVALYQYLIRQLGEEEAQEYFKVSGRIYLSPAPDYIVVGLDGLNCALMDVEQEMNENEPATCEKEKDCAQFGAQYRRTIIRARYCCFDLDQEKNPQKSILQAEGTSYLRFLGDGSSMNFRSANVKGIDVVQEQSRISLKLDQRCW